MFTKFFNEIRAKNDASFFIAGKHRLAHGKDFENRQVLLFRVPVGITQEEAQTNSEYMTTLVVDDWKSMTEAEFTLAATNAFKIIRNHCESKLGCSL